MAAPRIFLARLFHETNTFAAGTMGFDDFNINRGTKLLSFKGNGSPLGAFLEEAVPFGWEIVPTVDFNATPGAMPAQEVVDLFFSELEQALRVEVARGLDAIFLVLHGAMACPVYPDVEGELLKRIRAIPGAESLPLYGVLDLHCNFTAAMADHSTALLAYRKNPHTDAAETAVRATRLMGKALAGGIALRTRFVPTGVMWPPTGTGTAVAPMLTLETLAREEERDGVEEVNVFAGFSHADTPDTGVSFSIVYDPRRVSPERLEALAAKLRAATEAEKERGLPDEWELDAAIEDALAKGIYPVCLVEPADNIGGGAPGDGTAILRALLKHKIEGGGVVLNDPEAVTSLRDKAVGTSHDLKVGGRGFSLDPGPVPIKAKLIRLTDGQFILEDRHSHAASMGGIHADMGPCAVVETEGVVILLTSRRGAPMDLGQWRSQGVDPACLRFIGVKAAVAHRQAYDRISKTSYWVGTPGPCASALKTLPYKLIRRPVFPLDY